jgi:hypothetical protein
MVVVVIDVVVVVVVVVVEVVASVVVNDVVGGSVVVVVVVPAQEELDEASSETFIPSAWSPVTQALLPNEIEEDESLIDQDPSAAWLRMKSPFCQPSAPFLNRWLSEVTQLPAHRLKTGASKSQKFATFPFWLGK